VEIRSAGKVLLNLNSLCEYNWPVTYRPVCQAAQAAVSAGRDIQVKT